MIATLISVLLSITVVWLLATLMTERRRYYSPYPDPYRPDYHGLEDLYDIPPSRPHYGRRPGGHYSPQPLPPYPQAPPPPPYTPGHPPMYSPDYRYVWHPYLQRWVEQGF